MEVTDSTLDTVLRLVQNASRRKLLLELVESNPQDTAILAAEMGGTDDEVIRLETQLYHTHLPMLEDAGMIEWERDTDTVTRGPAFGEIRPLLELMAVSFEPERQLFTDDATDRLK